MTSLMSPYSLTPVTPDFDEIQDRLRALLLEQSQDSGSGAWTELLEVATGSFILRTLATVAADCAFALERAQHEIHLDTARRPSSIYTMARSHGVHIQRRQPASVVVLLNRSLNVSSTSVAIQPYTEFQVGGYRFFNRNPIVFPRGVASIEVTLFQGTLVEEEFVSDGSPFQEFIIGRKDFTTSDVDLFATVGDSSLKWKKTSTTGLWEFGPTDAVFYENSTPSGQVKVVFGDGFYGMAPKIGEVITFHYAVVDQDDILLSTAIPVDSACIVTGYPDLIGVTSSSPAGALGIKDPEFYRALAPHILDSNPMVSTRANYRAACLEYSGVLDAVVRGQAEINPSDVRWMCSIAVTLLTQSTWTESDFNSFREYLHDRGIAALHIYREDPQPVYVDISLLVSLNNRADLTSCKNKAEDLIKAMFEKKLGSLGRDYATTDFAYVIKNSIVDPYGQLVTSVDVLSPSSNVVCSYGQYPVLRNLEIAVRYDPSSQTKTVLGVTVPLQV